MDRVKAVFIITDLVTGGAERMVYNVLSCLNRHRFDIRVVSLAGIGPMGRKVQSLGVEVHALGMAPGMPNPRALYTLVRYLQNDRPDVVMTWLYHADLLGGLAAQLAGGIPTIWNIRNGNLLPESKRLLRWTVRIGSKVSYYLPKRIICCSEAARRQHSGFGYDARKLSVIPNGVDVTIFKPDEVARCSVRQELGLPLTAPLIGLIARFHPDKDHLTFVAAATRLHQHRPDVHFVLCGENVTEANSVLTEWTRGSGASDWFHLLGLRTDVPRLAAALDILTLSSRCEAFPNVLIEAMACEVPCVATDVGDSAFIIGDTGLVVPVRSRDRLWQAWAELLEAGPLVRHTLGIAARARIEQHFELGHIVSHYENIVEDVVRR